MITEHAQALFDPMPRIKSGSVHDARREAEERMKKAPDFYIRGLIHHETRYRLFTSFLIFRARRRSQQAPRIYALELQTISRM